MCALPGKLGYRVWGMQSENESDGREVRDLTKTRPCRALQNIVCTSLFTLTQIGSLSNSCFKRMALSRPREK